MKYLIDKEVLIAVLKLIRGGKYPNFFFGDIEEVVQSINQAEPYDDTPKKEQPSEEY